MYCSLNFEAKSSHKITVTTTDDGNPPLSFSKNLTIFLRNINDQPRDIRLSNYIVNETAPVDFVIGSFSASDEDEGWFSCTCQFISSSYHNLMKPIGDI